VTSEHSPAVAGSMTTIKAARTRNGMNMFPPLRKNRNKSREIGQINYHILLEMSRTASAPILYLTKVINNVSLKS
jgi:hypothetical protein